VAESVKGTDENVLEHYNAHHPMYLAEIKILSCGVV